MILIVLIFGVFGFMMWLIGVSGVVIFGYVVFLDKFIDEVFFGEVV